jgi:hypothetical protein
METLQNGKNMTIVGTLDDICHYEFGAFHYILNSTGCFMGMPLHGFEAISA